MKEEKRPLAEFLWVSGSLLPLAAVCLIWASTEGLTLASKLIVFVIGAAMGGFALLGAAEWLNPKAVAQVAPTPQAQNMPPYADLERAMREALVDPQYSAETKAVIQRKLDILPFKQEWRTQYGTSPDSEKALRSADGIAFLNRRLRESGKDWQITSENVASVFGSVALNMSIHGPYSAGIKITGGGGNTFDQTDIGGAQTGIDLQNTEANKFSNTRITAPSTPAPTEKKE